MSNSENSANMLKENGAGQANMLSSKKKELFKGSCQLANAYI